MVEPVFTEDSPKIKEIKHQARRKSIKEGIFATIQTSFGEYYISPFAIAINASEALIALITSITGLLGPISQIFSSNLLKRYSRKKIVRKSVLLQAILWLPLILISFLFYRGTITSFLPLALLLTYSFFIIVANIASPAWFSWIGDLVDQEYRGRWFAKRSLIIGFTSIIMAIIAAYFLQYFKLIGLEMWGFSILFFLAFLSRMISWKCLKKQYEPKLKIRKKDEFSLVDFIIELPRTNFGRFAIYRSLLAFAMGISAPFLAIYLLKDLQMSYSTYMIVTMASTVFSIAVVGLWGKFSDKYGNYFTIYITSIFLPTIPLLWILGNSFWYFIIVPSTIGGLAWSGFNLASSNFIYDNISSEKRGIAVSYYNILAGIGTFLGAGLGAILIEYIPNIYSLTPIAIIFCVGTIIRMAVVFFCLDTLKESRATEKFTGIDAVKNLLIKEIKPTLLNEAQQIISIPSYIKN